MEGSPRNVSKAYRAVYEHRYKGVARFPDEYLDHTLGLVRLTLRTRNLPWANA